ncbi:hypothetical protein [Magnetospirillum aberrantis]|uniref:Uncharacterized protein n=1 Tax=Magnetospirillum aberrantis SpK TaxID=908842 RepID=A0A7C9QUZ8_9PROT|nr:hypothetical protein [Magnetospirillum aberrantis]NFV81258.1 hypothetical protein [Magnetospirillum aberrantis SpK]
MTIATRVCATCVFWIPRDSDGAPVRGRCRARLLDAPDPRLAMMTQADFVCPQWCGKNPGRDAAE